jgi:TetR/AcrR family tetracycline transcriptional repressor
MARPKKALISLESAVQASIDVIEKNGLENFTLRSLAVHMGVSAPSMYHHFDNKAEVLHACARGLVTNVPAPKVSSLHDWKGLMRSMALNVYNHIMQRPRAAALLLEYFPHTMVFPFRNRAAEILAEDGLPMEDIVIIIRGFEKLTFGLILADASELLSGKQEWSEVPKGHYKAYTKALSATNFDSKIALAKTIDIYINGISSLLKEN